MCIRDRNLDPALVNKMGIVEKEGVLEVPVTAMIPPEFMGSGLGAASAESGDYDITSMEQDRLKELGLDKIRLEMCIRDSHRGRSGSINNNEKGCFKPLLVTRQYPDLFHGSHRP